jgi:hypothetical protein
MVDKCIIHHVIMAESQVKQRTHISNPNPEDKCIVNITTKLTQISQRNIKKNRLHTQYIHSSHNHAQTRQFNKNNA